MEDKLGIVRGICRSEQKGTEKSPVHEAFLRKDWGIEDDAHAGRWHRQVSLLAVEKIQDFRSKGGQVNFGAFGENLIIEGFDLRKIPVGSFFQIGKAKLRLSQIGKECHTHCRIYHQVGDCIMPREGVFAEVIESGLIKVGDQVSCRPPEPERDFSVAIITLSDKGARGEREDKSGPLIKERLEKKGGFNILEEILLSDDETPLKKNLIRLADQRQVELIFTTGGTGFSPRDKAPEVTVDVSERMATGIAEAIRAYSMSITRKAMFSRGTSVIRGKTLIINLPGSPKACDEALDAILEDLGHGLEVLRGDVVECGRM